MHSSIPCAFISTVLTADVMAPGKGCYFAKPISLYLLQPPVRRKFGTGPARGDLSCDKTDKPYLALYRESRKGSHAQDVYNK